jgi:hypothetical protein
MHSGISTQVELLTTYLLPAAELLRSAPPASSAVGMLQLDLSDTARQDQVFKEPGWRSPKLPCAEGGALCQHLQLHHR